MTRVEHAIHRSQPSQQHEHQDDLKLHVPECFAGGNGRPKELAAGDAGEEGVVETRGSAVGQNAVKYSGRERDRMSRAYLVELRITKDRRFTVIEQRID